MRKKRSEYGDTWYIIDEDDKIVRVFYSEKSASKYLKAINNKRKEYHE